MAPLCSRPIELLGALLPGVPRPFGSVGVMALSKLAAQFAAEIRQHDWSDAAYRADRAGHRRDLDSSAKRAHQHSVGEEANIRLNAMWVTAQVLAYNDPNFDVYEFSEACGCAGFTRAFIKSGLRIGQEPGTRG